jgi:hypothetical protein
MTTFKKHISFPSIEKFSTVVSNVLRRNNFVGLDENGNAIYDPSKPKPVIKFKGSVKLHGTNAGVCYNKHGGLWVQSRENIITPQSDNAGFAFFVESNKEVFMGLMADVAKNNNLGYEIDVELATISIYGEWCGASIQKGVGITNLPKSFFIFGVKITPHNVDNLEKPPVAYWVDHTYLRSPENKIYNINDYKTFEIDIDFNVPALVQNQIIDWTIEVENECPVAKAFGFPNTIGEGIVFNYTNEDGERLSFKSKGEKHSAKSKVHTLKPVDNEKINKCIEVANKVTPEWRLDQMLEKQFDFMNGGTMDVKKMGDYLKLVMNDVLKEEMDVLTEANIEPKDIGKYVSEIAKKYFFTRQNQEVGLK